MFDKDAEDYLRYQAKNELRKRMRGVRNSIPERALASRSEKIVERVLATPAYAKARSIGLFYPMEGRNEVDVRPIDLAARAAGKAVAYPFLRGPAEMALLCAEMSTLRERGSLFAEPPEDAPEVSADDGLVVIVPALAVDPTGQRVGYGKGFYDRLLERVVPPAFAIAVAYDFQVVAEVPRMDGDQPTNMVVTDLRTWVIER